MTTDDRELFEELLDDEEFAPGLTRADVLKRGAAAGAAVWGVSSLFGAQDGIRQHAGAVADPDLLPVDLRPVSDIPKGINKDYGKRHKLDAKIAPVAGFGIDALHRRDEEEEEHVGRLRRHDPVRRDGSP